MADESPARRSVLPHWASVYPAGALRLTLDEGNLELNLIRPEYSSEIPLLCYLVQATAMFYSIIIINI